MGSRPGHGDWNDEYAGDVPPPWEIGAAQPALAAVVDRVTLEAPVLDVGCGTGELAILVARRGYQVVGIDCSVRAVDIARAKAAKLTLDISFLVGDAEHLEGFAIRPRTVFDSGLLHNLDPAGRAAYVAGLAAICEAGAVVYVLAVSQDAGKGWDLTRDGLNRLFRPPDWVAAGIETADVLANVEGEKLHLPGLLLTVERAG